MFNVKIKDIKGKTERGFECVMYEKTLNTFSIKRVNGAKKEIIDIENKSVFINDKKLE